MTWVLKYIIPFGFDFEIERLIPSEERRRKAPKPTWKWFERLLG